MENSIHQPPPEMAARWPDATPCPLGDFLRDLQPDAEVSAHSPCAVLADSRGQLSRHVWGSPGLAGLTRLADAVRGARGGYITPAMFRTDSTGRLARKKAQAVGAAALWADIEGVPGKGGYNNEPEALGALAAFIAATGLVPTHLVTTSSGGVHAYWMMTRRLSPDEWGRLVKALVALAAAAGLKTDVPVTLDLARIMRAPESIHQGTGGLVRAFKTRESYTPTELASLLKAALLKVGQQSAGQDIAPTEAGPRFTAADLAINGDLGIKATHIPFSMLTAARHCGAINLAMRNRGADTGYAAWLLAIHTAALSIDGEPLAQVISSGHGVCRHSQRCIVSERPNRKPPFLGAARSGMHHTAPGNNAANMGGVPAQVPTRGALAPGH